MQTQTCELKYISKNETHLVFFIFYYLFVKILYILR